MKKFVCLVVAVLLSANVIACPDGVYIYDEECDCYEDSGSDYYDSDYCDDSYSYDCSWDSYQGYYKANVMAHWANVRDACGNIIGTVGQGDAVEVIGTCADNPSRSLVYNPCTGSYGTIASVYIYGGTAYEYENPTEYSGAYNCYSDAYIGCYNETPCETYYEAPTCPYVTGYDGIIYDETTPWACDNLEAYYEEENYPYEYYEEEYYEDDDESYFSFYGDDEIWVDVDISSQTINIYNGNVVILSGACVTGMSGVSDTPCGQYTILGKQRNATLVGADYECPVDYWMPFTESGCGFHDASWRGDFGGDIYEYDGSHGCVNLEEGFVQEMYEIVPEGCRVNVHGLG